LQHNLEDILVIALAALLCNGEGFQDIETFGQQREGKLKKFLELPHGIPEESMFFRVFRRIKPAVNIDGKTIRGSGNMEQGALHVVSEWAGEEEIILDTVSKGRF
jgi:hypothetical protein